MRSRRFVLGSFFILSASISACSGAPATVVDAGTDSQVPDATLDIATTDAANDADTLDANTVDASATDGDTLDANTLDANTVDASVDCSALPPRDCVGTEAYCGELVQFSPSSNDDYDDYPYISETAGNLFNSYGRRDLVMLITYATAKVGCLTRHLAPAFHPLGIGDMSEAGGDAPGTATMSPNHPAGTHENGLDVDVAYYQVGTTDNRIRSVCSTVSDGVNVYHCTEAPMSLDVVRTALFLGALAESSRVRLIAVDGRIGPLVETEIAELCASGAITPDACTRMQIGYETSDTGRGLFLFHYHLMHISLTAPPP